MEARVVAASGDHVTVEVPDKDEVEAMEDLELALTRIAGGFVVADSAETRRRWNIASVDGWSLGMPGPGPAWAPSNGVKLMLETLGSCRACSEQLAQNEYICNSASRSFSSSRSSHAGGPHRPRAKMVDAETQTEVEYRDSGVQCAAPTAEAQVQASRLPRAAVCRAQAVAAGVALAELAVPAPGSRTEASVSDELVLTADRATARRCVRSALAAVATSLITETSTRTTGSGLPPAAERRNAAVHAVQQVEAAAEVGSNAAPAEEAAPCPDRILGHRRRAALPRGDTPTEEPASEAAVSGLPSLEFQDGAAKAMAGAALAALERVPPHELQANPVSWPFQLPAPAADSSVVNLEESAAAIQDEADSILLMAKQSIERNPSIEEPIFDAIVNLSGVMLCSPGSLMEASRALAAVAEVLPKAAALVPPWRQLATTDSWPGAAGTAEGKRLPPRGWPVLRAALASLVDLISEDAGGPESEAAEAASAGRALQALARLALFVDGEAQAVEDKSLAEEAEARRRAEQEALEAWRRQQGEAQVGGPESVQQPLQPGGGPTGAVDGGGGGGLLGPLGPLPPGGPGAFGSLPPPQEGFGGAGGGLRPLGMAPLAPLAPLGGFASGGGALGGLSSAGPGFAGGGLGPSAGLAGVGAAGGGGFGAGGGGGLGAGGGGFGAGSGGGLGPGGGGFGAAGGGGSGAGGGAVASGGAAGPGAGGGADDAPGDLKALQAGMQGLFKKKK